jgi:hypothetical protein
MRCSNCGSLAAVGPRQTRRINANGSVSRCVVCRGRNYVASESDYRYWLTRFGVEIPKGVPALEVVRASGMPAELREIALGWRDSR